MPAGCCLQHSSYSVQECNSYVRKERALNLGGKYHIYLREDWGSSLLLPNCSAPVTCYVWAACLSFCPIFNCLPKTNLFSKEYKNLMHLNITSYSTMCSSALKHLSNTVQNWQLGNAWRMTDCCQGGTGCTLCVFLVRMSLSSAQGS